MSVSSGAAVESKILELKLENRGFEANAKTSISTLEKLKHALDFSSKTKAFDDVNDSIKNVNVKTLTSGVQTFNQSLLSVAKNAAVFRVVSNAVDDVERKIKSVAKSLTIEQASAGWTKYADKTSAVQTIMAATAKDFSDTAEQMEVVNQQLDKLNWFTDETSYNFVDMVGNIGKFTSNNVELSDAVTAMEGIANWAAISGGHVNEASRAMYNLSQAIGVGAVKLMDWKSIENANMATYEFKQTAIDTAVEVGTLTKVTDDLYRTVEGNDVSASNFNEALKDEWFNSDVLIKTLNKYGKFTDELYAFMEKTSGESSASTILGYINEFAETGGLSDWDAAVEETGMSVDELKESLASLSDETLEFGRKSFRAAQEAKTFDEAIESVKDATSTGWMNTYELLFGDYLQAKTLWTDLAETLWELFASSGEKRNELLKEALDMSGAITESDWNKLEKAGAADPKFIKALREAATEHGHVIDDMLSDEEWLNKALEEQAINVGLLKEAYADTFGSDAEAVVYDEDLKKTVSDLKETDETFAGLLETVEQYDAVDVAKIVFGDKKYAEGARELEQNLDKIIKYLNLEQASGNEVVAVLKALGYFGGSAATETTELSGAIDELGSQSKTGSELWTESLYHVMHSMTGLSDTIKAAWRNVFPEKTADDVYQFFVYLEDITGKMEEFVTDNEQLESIFTGVFSVFDLIVSGYRSLRGIVLSIFKGFYEGLGIDFLGVFADFGDKLLIFRNWIKELGIFAKVSDIATKAGHFLGTTLRDRLITPISPSVIGNVKRFGDAFKATFTGMGPFLKDGQKRLENFIMKIASMGKIKIGDLPSIFKNFREEALDWLSNFPGFDKFQQAFRMLGTSVKVQLQRMGIDTDAIKEKFNSFVEIIKPLGDDIKSKFLNSISAIKSGFQSFLQLPSVEQNINNFKAAFITLSENIGKHLKNTGAKVTEFINKVKTMGGIKLSNIGTVFSTFKKTVVDYFTDFDGFKAVSDAFDTLKDTIKDKLRSAGIDVDAIKDKFKTFTNTDWLGAIKSALSDMGIDVDAVKDKLAAFAESNVFENIKSAFIGLKDTVKLQLSGIGIDVDAIKEKIVSFITDLLKSLETIDLPKPLENFLNLLTGTVVAEASEVAEAGFNGLDKAAYNFTENTENAADSGNTALDALFENIKYGFEVFRSMSKEFKKYTGPILLFLGVTGILKRIGDIPRAISGIFKAMVSPIEKVEGLAKTINKLLTAKGGVLDMIFGKDGFIGSLATLQQTRTKELKRRQLLELVACVALLAGAVWLLAQVPEEDLTRCLVAIGLLALIVGALAAAASSLKNTRGLAEIGIGIAAIGVGIMLIVGALKLIETIKEDKLKEHIGSIAGILLSVLAITFIMGKFGSGGAGGWSTGVGVLAVITSIFLILALLKKLEKYKAEELNESLAKFDKLLLHALLIAAVLGSISAKGTLGGALMLVAMGMLLGKMAKVMASLGDIPIENLRKAEEAITVIGIIAAGLLFMVSQTKGASWGSILALAAVIAALTISMVALYMLDSRKLLKVALTLGIVIAAIAALAYAAGKAGKSKGALAELIIIVALVGAMIYALTAFTDPDKAINVANSLTGVFIGLAAIMAAVAVVSKFASVGGIIKSLITIVLILGAFAAVAVGLGYLVANNPGLEALLDRGIPLLIKIADGLGRVISAFIGGIALQAASYMPEFAGYLKEFFESLEGIANVNGDDIVSALWNMLGAILVGLEMAVFALEGIVVSIGEGVSQALTGKSMAENFRDNLNGLVAAFQEINTAIQGGGGNSALGGILSSVTAMFFGIVIELGVVIFELEGLIGALIDAGVKALTGTGSVEFFKLNLLGMLDAFKAVNEAIQGDEGNAAIGGILASVTTIVASMVAELGIVAFQIESLIGALLEAGVKAIAGMGSTEFFKNNLVGMIEAYNALADACEPYTGLAVGAAVVMPLAGIASELGLIVFGALGGINALLNKGIEKITGGRDAAEDFGKQLTELAAAFNAWNAEADFGTAISSVTSVFGSIMGIVTEIGLLGFNVIGGLNVILRAGQMGISGGQTAADQMKEDLVALADGFNSWGDSIDNTTAIDSVSAIFATIGGTFVQLGILAFDLTGLINGVLTNWTKKLTGGNTAAEQMKEDLVTLATGIGDWKKAVDDTGNITKDVGDFELNIKTLTDAIKDLPLHGLIGAMGAVFTGTDEENVAKFTTNIGSLATGLNTFAESLGDKVTTERVSTAAELMASMSSLINNLGVWSAADNDFTDMSTSLTSFGQAIVAFANEHIPHINDLSAFSTFAEACSLTVGAANDMNALKIDGDMIDESLISNFVSNIETLKTAIEGLADIDTSGVSKFTNAASDLVNADIKSAIDKVASSKSASSEGKDIASGISSGISNDTSIGSSLNSAVSNAMGSIETSGFSGKGTEMVDAIATAISGSSAISDAFSTVLSNAYSTISGYYSQFQQVGGYLMSGLAHGIAEKGAVAIAAAQRIANTIISTLKSAAEINSPSKVTRRIGGFIGEGLVLGLNDWANRVGDSAYNMANSAMNGMRRSISTLSRSLEEDLDAQPVIRPVLDLTNIQDGAGTISDILRISQPTIGVTGNLNAISYNMRDRDMTSSGDILSALQLLGDTLSKAPSGDTYNVNGITYDDGSNITDAVRTLIRAAKVGRRA